jgi:cobalt-precorrin 5A hydrolase
MNVAIVTLSSEGAIVGGKIAAQLAGSRLFVHTSAVCQIESERFDSIMDVTQKLFHGCRKLVYVAPCGVVIRAIAPWLQHKTTDPAVVVVDVGGRYAISLLSGHEGGANVLALQVANVLGAEPVISTTSEAAKTLIVGVGCRRGATAEPIVGAIRAALCKVGATQDQVRLLSSASIKSKEAGLLQAADELGLNLRFISCEEILSTTKRFQHSRFVAEKVKLPAVAEPSALLAGRRTQLILPKTIINGVTVAIARENCS